MITSLRSNRRSFLKTIAAASGTLAFPSLLRAQGANRKLGIAAIGAMGKGESDLIAAAEGNEVVAVCDVDANHLAKIGAKFPGAKQYKDFRKMLDEMKSIDAVTISTPDHTHYPAAMHAMAHGKHVFIQKPLTNTIWECRELHKAARKKSVITQMGNQGHTGEGNRVLKEWIEGGAIGKVKEIHVWTNKPVWPQGRDAIIKPNQNPPSHLDWQLWLGATPDAPYAELAHPFNWRGFREWGGGCLGDMGCHHIDAPMFALGLSVPEFFSAEADNVTDIAWPSGAKVKMEWNNVPGHGSITLTWHEGKNSKGEFNQPEWPAALAEEAFKESKPPGAGFLIVGSEGFILNGGDQCEWPQIWSKKRREEFLSSNYAKNTPRSVKPGSPQQEWSEAIKNGKEFPWMSHVDYAAPLTELCLVGALSMLLGGKRFQWDSKTLTAVGIPEAAKFIKRAAYRPGFDYTADKI